MYDTFGPISDEPSIIVHYWRRVGELVVWKWDEMQYLYAEYRWSGSRNGCDIVIKFSLDHPSKYFRRESDYTKEISGMKGFERCICLKDTPNWDAFVADPVASLAYLIL